MGGSGKSMKKLERAYCVFHRSDKKAGLFHQILLRAFHTMKSVFSHSFIHFE
jgi:hypothetical protein